MMTHHGLHGRYGGSGGRGGASCGSWSCAPPRVAEGHWRRVQFVTQVGQGVGFAVVVGGDGGAAAASRFARSSRACWRSADRRVISAESAGTSASAASRCRQNLGQRGHFGGESGDDVPCGVVSCGDLLEVDAGVRESVWH